MNLGFFGDTHYTNRGPSRRNDNFFETQINKSLQAFSIFEQYNCSVIFQPGDLFDSHTVSNEVKARIIKLYKNNLKQDEKILFVSGQHDISGHSLYTLKNSPLAVVQAAGVGKLLAAKPYSILDLEDGRTVQVYGASYGEPIPEPESEMDYNILVIHKMIGDRELFPGQELTKPNQFLRNNPKFNLVLCGDYHYRFSSQYEGRTIVNPGCLVRKTISKFDLEHKPSVAIFNIEENEVKFIELDIRPSKEVFNLNQETKIDKLGTEKLIQALKENLQGPSGQQDLKWKNLLLKVIKEKGSSDKIREIIDETIEEVQG